MLKGWAELPRCELTRRRVVLSMVALGSFPGLDLLPKIPTARLRQPSPDPFEVVAPKAGIDTGVSFGSAIRKLIAVGALDPGKLKRLTQGVPDWVEELFAAPSSEPIVFTRDRAPYLVNLLWPIGLSSKAGFNRKSPIATIQIPGLASTGGWTLGRAPNGYVYFDTVDAVMMNQRQEALALAIASTAFRPCCDNSTYFQDCNHGSALLGLIELAAAQGKSEEAIYRIAVVANSYWFPEQYAKTALYARHFEGASWNAAPARLIMSAAFSSLSGWERNVNAPLRKAGIHLPGQSGVQPTCGI